MKKTCFVIVLAFATAGLILPAQTNALSGSEFQPGRIIDDNVFFNGRDMEVSQIQQFLNTKVPTCDTNGTVSKSYYYNASTGELNNDNEVSDGDAWVTTNRAVYGQRYNAYYGVDYADAPYYCLKNYQMNTPSRAAEPGLCNAYTGKSAQVSYEIIYDVAISCDVSAKALIVLLQKEQGLITDDWPWDNQYLKATGYACPDTAPCDSQYFGFFNQVYSAARQFKRYSQSPSLFNHRANRNNLIRYNPNAGCGESSVFIQNQATAGLYNYTPYQPNDAALGNLDGSGNGCSAFGNRNFWRDFNRWFGNTLGPNYSWSIQSFTYANGDNLLTPGVEEQITLKAKNTGRSPWYNHGPNVVRLGTWEPPDHASPLYSPGWLSQNRPASLTEAQVLPGEVGTFTFPLKLNSAATYAQSFNLVVENSEWMAWPGFRPTIIGATSPYQWQINSVIYDSGTGVMEPGTAQLVTLIARNTGNTTWSKSNGIPIRLATWQPGRQSSLEQSWISPVRVIEMNENTVAPGGTAGFQFLVKAPPTSGLYYERFNLVAEGQAWFNDPGLTLYIKSGAYAWQPVWSSISTGSATIDKGQSFTITIRARNTGDLTWRKSSGGPPVRLGTAGPLNRGSHLYSPTWLSDIRPTGLIENSVAPGQEGTFSFTAKASQTTGPITESFNLVAEGQQWFASPDITFNLTIR